MKEQIIKRQIDELGRIVIPRDIRRQANIKPRDYIIIYCEDKVIKLERERCQDQFDFICNQIAKVFYDKFNNELIIMNKEIIISTFGKNVKQYCLKQISLDVYKLIKDEHLGVTRQNGVQITDENYIDTLCYYLPIKYNYYNIGGILILENKKINFDEKLISFINDLINN